MNSLKRTRLGLRLILMLVAGTVSLNAQVISPKEIDQVVDQAMKTFDVPGIAVAVIKDDKIIHEKGYGIRSIITKEPVDKNTLFGIASNTKAFTVAALGILIDEGKLSWDSKVADIIPEFRLYDPYVTEDFTIKDMLTHRSGLGLGAGDLMIWPGPNNYSKEEIINNLRYLKQASDFRTKYDYDNLMYIVAGEVVKRVSGMTWEEFVETHIMQPLGMAGSAASFNRLKDKSDVIDTHAPVNGVITVVGRHDVENSNSAGGIYSNIDDLSKWVMMQLNDGRYGENKEKQIFSKSVHREMWSPQTIEPVSDDSDYNTHFRCYGLGFHLSDAMGYLKVEHSGELSGMVTKIIMIPELKLGIIVLTNQQSTAAFDAISKTILDSYLGVKGKNRIKEYQEYVEKDKAQAKKITDAVWAEINSNHQPAASIPDLSIFTGTYSDIWFGKVTISLHDGKLRFSSERSPRISGEMMPYKGTTFIAKWDDRSLDADAYVIFTTDTEGKASGMRLKAISPLTDFSYDFQDLDFKRIN